jgi:hypothetical protein
MSPSLPKANSPKVNCDIPQWLALTQGLNVELAQLCSRTEIEDELV